MVFMQSEWAGFWLWKANAITVSRMQDKIVETPDGVMHAVINGGPRNEMAIYVSTDGGHSWHESFGFENTGRLSTAHLVLLDDGETLTVSFQASGGDIMYQPLVYDPGTVTWSAMQEASVVQTGNANVTLGLPNHILVPDGTIYSLSMATSLLGPRVALAQSLDNGLTWETFDFRIADVDHASVRGVVTPDVLGIIAATDTYLGWYDVTDPDAELVKISEYGSATVFASHYSMTVVGNDIFLGNVTSAEVPQVEFFIYDGDIGAWSDPINLPGTFDSEAYVQVSSNTEGHLYVTIDEYASSRLRVLESLDGGTTWETVAEIDVGPDVFPGFTRMVAPEYFTEDLVIFQMVQPNEGSNFYGINVSVVDVDGDGSAAQFQAEVDAITRDLDLESARSFGGREAQMLQAPADQDRLIDLQISDYFDL